MSNQIHTQVKKTRKINPRERETIHIQRKNQSFCNKNKEEIGNNKQTTTAENNHCEREKQTKT